MHRFGSELGRGRRPQQLAVAVDTVRKVTDPGLFVRTRDRQQLVVQHVPQLDDRGSCGVADRRDDIGPPGVALGLGRFDRRGLRRERIVGEVGRDQCIERRDGSGDTPRGRHPPDGRTVAKARDPTVDERRQRPQLGDVPRPVCRVINA